MAVHPQAAKEQFDPAVLRDRSLVPARTSQKRYVGCHDDITRRICVRDHGFVPLALGDEGKVGAVAGVAVEQVHIPGRDIDMVEEIQVHKRVV